MRYHFIALFTVGVWGITFVSTKVLLVSFSPLWILLLRFILGFLALAALRPRILRLQKRRHELLFAAAGLTGIAAYYLLENVALVFTTATAVGVIVAASPLFTALIAAASGDRSALNLRFLLGFALAMTGLGAVGFSSADAQATRTILEGADLFGDLLALLAALVWALYSTLVKRIADLGYETIASTKRTFLWGLAFIAPATLAAGGPIPAPAVFLDGANAANLLFLGIVASAACFATWGAAVKHLGATVSTTYIYLVPAITAVSSIAILGEPLTAGVIAGVILTIAGLILSQKRSSGNPTAREDNGASSSDPTM